MVKLTVPPNPAFERSYANNRAARSTLRYPANEADTQIGRFEVTSHLELTGRGAFVIGRIRAGIIRPGMYVDTYREPPRLRVAGVECVDNIIEKKYWNALVFAERPTLDFVKVAFPVGSVIELRADKSAEAVR